jgi:hypothetical protein
MDKLRKLAIVALLCTGVCAATPKKPAQKAAPQKPSAATPASATAVPVPVMPQAPPTPENMPAKAPQVSLSNGMLSIVAENSTLGDVLNGIHKATGASVDIPPAASAERVVVNIGPTEPRDALQQLLSGSKFDYIIVGSPANDATLEKVILTARTGGASGPAAVAANRAPAYQPPPQPSYEPPAEQEDNYEDNSVNTYQPEPTPEVNMPPQPANGQPAQTGQDQQNQQGPKTPEQLLRQLQQMRGQQSDQGQANERPDRNPQEE